VSASGAAWRGVRSTGRRAISGQDGRVASYSVNPEGVAWAQRLIDSGQYVLDSDWGKVQPRAREQNAFLKSHSWDEYAQWHLALTEGAADQTKARYAFAYGDFRRLHRMGIIACQYRAAEWRHKDIELAASAWEPRGKPSCRLLGAPRHRPSVFDLQPDDLSTAGSCARQRLLDVLGLAVSVASRSQTTTTCRLDFTIHVPRPGASSACPASQVLPE
jgi:hypothetical protein